MLIFLGQQATELLVTLAEIGLARYEDLVALTQLLVQLSTNTNMTKNVGEAGLGKEGINLDNLEMGFQMKHCEAKLSLWVTGRLGDIKIHIFSYFHDNIMKNIC